MAALWKEDTCQSFESTHRCYIHIENLPEIFCQSEVKTLFKEFDIPKGGIAIYGSDAFVVFMDIETASDALSSAKALLHDTPMRASLIKTTKIMTEIIHQKVRRNLNFDSDKSCSEISSYNSAHDSSAESGIVLSDDETPEVFVTAYGRKRIRPTSIPQGCKRFPFSCLKFFPEETAFPRQNCIPSKNIKISTRTEEQLRTRKIRPKPAIHEESFGDWEKSPDDSRETKRIKLEQSAAEEIERTLIQASSHTIKVDTS